MLQIIISRMTVMLGKHSAQNNHTPRHQSAAWLVTVLAISVFVAELIVMVVLPFLPPMSEFLATFLDAAFLLLLLLPVFYFLVFRPLVLGISERERAELSLRESESRFHKMADDAPALIWMADTRNLGNWYNQRWLNYTGRSMEQELGFGWLEGMHPDDRPRCASLCQTAFDRRERFEMEFRLRRADGSYGWVADVGTPRFDVSGNFLGYIGYCWEIDNRKETEMKLRLSANVFTHAREGIVITDPHGTIVDVNDTFTRITGYAKEEVLGKNPRILQSGRQSAEFYSMMWKELIHNGYWSGEVWNRKKSGEVYAELLTISAIRDTSDVTLNYVALFSDITSIKEHQKQLEHIAHYDVLTKLPNRALLSDRLNQAMHQTIRRNRSLAVAFLDLDGFKQINDVHGHKAGDDLLIAISERISHVLREGDTLARIGGDEFVALLVDLEDPHDCDQVLDRVLQAAAEPVIVNRLALNVSASIGVTIYPQDDVDADLLMRHADHAMYSAKQAGKSRVHYFNVNDENQIEANASIIMRLEKALTREELRLYVQPKIHLRTGEVVGGEALIRWQHPVRGLVPPNEFLPLIEEEDLAIGIGDWVFRDSLRILSDWAKLGLLIPLSVNVFARQLREKDFPQKLQAILEEFPQVSPEFLEIEIVESTVIDDIGTVSKHIAECKAMGVRFSLDDFGTGYSSLTYLKQLSVNALKIDQSFIRDMLEDEGDLAIVSGVIGLARSFKNETVAEGIECLQQAACLRELGCDIAQGYWISHPLPPEEIPAWKKQFKLQLH